MPQVAIVVMIVAAVASMALQMKAANDQKKAAKRSAALQLERMEIEKRERELEANRARANLRRQARARRGAIANAAAAQGTISTTSLSGAINALDMGEGREMDFADQKDVLAGQAFDVAGQGVALNLSIAKTNANNKQVGAFINMTSEVAGAFMDQKPNTNNDGSNHIANTNNGASADAWNSFYT